MSFFDKKPTGGLFSGPGKSMFSGPDDEDEADDLEGLDPEQVATRVLSEAEQAFKDRAQAEARRFELATDSEYWVAMGFQSRRQKEQFLSALREKLGLADDGDKYLDGWEVAKALGIHLDREEVPYNTSARQDKKWLSLTR